MRSPIRRRHAALAALSAGLLLTAGCAGSVSGNGTPGAEELYLQTAAVQGPDPFSESTAVAAPGPSVHPTSSGVADRSGATARAARSLPGSTPGLYAGAASLSSCDVERQIRFLTEDRTRATAFARGAGIGQTSVPSFLRKLTPVTLRADIRMTNHGYRGGTARPFQAVLQAGTAVMVDDHGMPRVRCACGNPLRPAVAAQGGVVHRGEQWPGYRPDRVVVISRTPQAVSSLVIVDLVNNAWLERRTGTDGAEDRPPGVPPPYAPDADITDPDAVQPSAPAAPDGSPSLSPGETTPEPDCPTATGPGGGSAPVPPGCPTPGPGDTPPDGPGTPSDPDLPGLPPGDEGGTPPDDELFPPMPDPEQTSVELVGPDTFQG